MSTEPESRWSEDTVALGSTQGPAEEQAERLRYVAASPRRGHALRWLALGALVCAAAGVTGAALALTDNEEPTQTAGSMQLTQRLETRFERARERERLVTLRTKAKRRAARRARRRAVIRRERAEEQAAVPVTTAEPATPSPAPAPVPTPTAPAPAPPPEQESVPAPQPRPTPASPPPVQREFGIEH